ncbi:hypothetical protein MBM_02211 [Drepanopeziza brunnea f. sp. 'multigermtubi' MB_m1]|uniref:Uncharacterized protein n=1 Tax=Marssonina brunnea f. sp. multigermtubi (strain MB_m1) TaxID=1072389 RepID=K1Y536_MARBU|nr:uncharacterized protein MBM_02211 [Drepanopeziza brunnea f. sp. 'multigermtubi' MB_m1]EKD20259.1 hypothetical protein MBM_02211 [Drepanopeziza brunnea f. sp. 'multigermtubi' MB_m1]
MTMTLKQQDSFSGRAHHQQVFPAFSGAQNGTLRFSESSMGWCQSLTRTKGTSAKRLKPVPS